MDDKLSKIYDNTLAKTVTNNETEPILIATKTVSVQTSDSVSQTTDAAIKENNAVSPDIQTVRQSSTCSYYIKGKCRHGSNGKKLVNGNECKYLHPPKCVKYCRYGNSAVGGCSGPCDLLHPIICQSSIQYKSCLSRDCTFAHLAGTRRTRDGNPPEIYNYQPFTQGSGYQYPKFQRDQGNRRDYNGYPKLIEHQNHSVWNRSRDPSYTQTTGPSIYSSDVGSVSQLTTALIDSLLQRAAQNNIPPQEVIYRPSSFSNPRDNYNPLPQASHRSNVSMINAAKNYPAPNLPYPQPQ